MEEQPYDIIAQSYAVGGEIMVDPRCNGWTAINTGDTLVRVCGIPLLPFPPGHPELSGSAIAIPGNFGEVYRGRIWIVFDDVPGANPLVCIIQKYYKGK
jgi:hypothetical protein